MADKIAVVGIDWGTTNRRAWAFAADGRVIDNKSDGEGLLSLARDQFAPSFAAFIRTWREADPGLPVLMCGMVGSKLGWIEAPYLRLPVALEEFAQGLWRVPSEKAWIVPGACDEAGNEPDVMRGEECQLFGALLKQGVSDAVFVLPGTHSKWAIVAKGRLVHFRTYMTGEIFNMLSSSGTIAQLIRPGEADDAEFDRGVARGLAVDSELLHSLFGVRTLALFDRLTPTSVKSHLSGLLIGAEFADALKWTGHNSGLIAIGSPHLLAGYKRAAHHVGIALTQVESGTVLPDALYNIAKTARLFSVERP